MYKIRKGCTAVKVRKYGKEYERKKARVDDR